jgi:hypothetical protein
MKNLLDRLEIPSEYSVEQNADGTISVIIPDEGNVGKMTKNSVLIREIDDRTVDVQYASPHADAEVPAILRQIDERLFNWSAIARLELPAAFYESQKAG